MMFAAIFVVLLRWHERMGLDLYAFRAQNARMMTCTVEGCAMCDGRSCANCNVDDLASPCAHDVVERHLRSQRIEARTPSSGHLEARVPTKPLPEMLLADRIEVDPADPDSVAHFLETWAQIVRTKRRFIIVLQ